MIGIRQLCLVTSTAKTFTQAAPFHQVHSFIFGRTQDWGHAITSTVNHLFSRKADIENIHKIRSLHTLNPHVNYLFSRNGNNEDIHKTYFRNFRAAQICGVSKKTYIFPEIKEEELKETFVRGSGPGGQSVNKTTNCVVLQHLPTGVTVKCHETRSLVKNRKRARERLVEQVDFCLNGENSFLALRVKENSQSRLLQKKTNKRRLEMKKAFKEREGLD